LLLIAASFPTTWPSARVAARRCEDRWRSAVAGRWSGSRRLRGGTRPSEWGSRRTVDVARRTLICCLNDVEINAANADAEQGSW